MTSATLSLGRLGPRIAIAERDYFMQEARPSVARALCRIHGGISGFDDGRTATMKVEIFLAAALREPPLSLSLRPTLRACARLSLAPRANVRVRSPLSFRLIVCV